MDTAAIRLVRLTEANVHHARSIDREDIPEEWVDTADTIIDLNQYGLEHRLLGHTFLAYLGETCIGLILIGEAIPWETDPAEMQGVPFYRVMGFVVDRAYRSRGYGSVILEQAVEMVYKDFGKRPLALGVHRENVHAGRFYERHGFRRTGVYEGMDEYYLRME
ncbi:MAG: GNAT family N-acetyltransferase [Clostridia bacterium]|nr:GNAT family N-acetyltransferase [Clostridia bacterium]